MKDGIAVQDKDLQAIMSDAYTVQMTADEARKLFDVAETDGDGGNWNEPLLTALDNAQGEVFNDDTGKVAWLVIKITNA